MTKDKIVWYAVKTGRWVASLNVDGRTFAATIDKSSNPLSNGNRYVGHLDGERKCTTYSLADCRATLEQISKEIRQQQIPTTGTIYKTIAITWRESFRDNTRMFASIAEAEKAFADLIEQAKTLPINTISNLKMDVSMEWVAE